MKVLIPTDFSQLSKIAIQYAIALSQDFELDLVLLHVVNTNTPAMARLSSKKLEEAIKSNSEQDMNQLIKTIKNEYNHNLNISPKIIFGPSIEKEVETFALENSVDMICIGTKGATGLKKILYGSNAAGIISNSSIPVLTIPEYAKYNGIHKIVYSSDLANLEKELELIIPFAELMNAWVHILHITKEGFHEDLQHLVNRLRTSFFYEKIKVKSLENDSIIEGINQYVAAIDADIVTMFTRHTSLIQKLFNKSVTKMAAFQAKTPLLTFQKE